MANLPGSNGARDQTYYLEWNIILNNVLNGIEKLIEYCKETKDQEKMALLEQQIQVKLSSAKQLKKVVPSAHPFSNSEKVIIQPTPHTTEAEDLTNKKVFRYADFLQLLDPTIDLNL